MKKFKKKKREFENINGLMVFEKQAYFNDYVINEVGAAWLFFVRTLYDAGFTKIEVSNIRQTLQNDFLTLCAANGFTPHINNERKGQ